jgi:hypothetical protein
VLGDTLRKEKYLTPRLFKVRHHGLQQAVVPGILVEKAGKIDGLPLHHRLEAHGETSCQSRVSPFSRLSPGLRCFSSKQSAASTALTPERPRVRALFALRQVAAQVSSLPRGSRSHLEVVEQPGVHARRLGPEQLERMTDGSVHRHSSWRFPAGRCRHEARHLSTGWYRRVPQQHQGPCQWWTRAPRRLRPGLARRRCWRRRCRSCSHRTRSRRRR